MCFARVHWGLYAAHAQRPEGLGPACYVRLELIKIKRKAASIGNSPQDFAQLMAKADEVKEVTRAMLEDNQPGWALAAGSKNMVSTLSEYATRYQGSPDRGLEEAGAGSHP